MLNKEEIEKARSNLLRGNDIESAALITEAIVWDGLVLVGGRVNIAKVAMRQILNFIEENKNKGNLDYIREKVKANERAKRLEEENKSLKEVLNIGLNKEKQYCFNEDGNTGMCLGYGDDKPCDYCKSCKKLNLKEED